jgi:hypothetical protein
MIVAFLLAVSVPAIAAAPPVEAQDTLVLEATQLLEAVGYSIRYPSDWSASMDGPVVRIVQPERNGIQVVFDGRGLGFMHDLGLPEGATLDELVAFNTSYFGILYSAVERETTEALFGAPARRIRFVQANGVAFDVLQGFVGDLVVLLYASAPSADALRGFDVTFETMLQSIEPVDP